MMRYLLSLFFLFFFFQDSLGQFRQVGTWRYYINSRGYNELENIDGNIFVNARRVIFDIETDPFELSPLERTNGLSDYSISTMAYNESAKKLFIAYDNTMVDIISFKNGNKSITSNFDIYNKLIVADKTIQQIKFFRNRAYFCSRLGIIVLNYDKNEVESTYIIGNRGNQLGVYTVEIVGNKIYAATDEGIKEALINPAINLQDYSNWSAPLTSIPQDTFFRSNQMGGKTYWMSKSAFYDFDGSTSNRLLANDTLRKLVNLRKIGNLLYLIYDSLKPNKDFYSSKILSYDGAQFQLVKETFDARLYDIVYTKSKFYFSGNNGFFENQSTDLKRIQLNNYPYDFPFRLQLSQNKLFVSMGIMQRNLDAFLIKEGHFILDNNYWYNYGIWGDSLSDCTNEISSIERDGGTYRAYVRGGVSFEKNGSNPVRFRSNNSKLGSDGGVYQTSDMVYNPVDSSIWIANKSSSQPLVCLTRSGKWYSFDLSSVMNSTEIYRIVIDLVGNKWLLTRSDGLILFNEKDINNNGDNIIKKITEIKSRNCNLNITKPICAVVDRDGNLWVGADKGVGMITNCTYEASEECIYSVPDQRINNPNDTTTYYECVFLNTAVTALAVDAGNRLWVGTPDGVFYNDEYLDAEFIRLNKLNSPFSVKSIYDILVHPNTGEVFFTTEVGLISYMGQSSSAEIHEGISPYRVIPNPVPRDYQGLVTIDGLPENAYFKITDVVGNLMYQGQSNGSRVTWDTRSLNGIKVPTGVYYIFSSKSQLRGTQGVGKFTVIR